MLSIQPANVLSWLTGSNCTREKRCIHKETEKSHSALKVVMKAVQLSRRQILTGNLTSKVCYHRIALKRDNVKERANTVETKLPEYAMATKIIQRDLDRLPHTSSLIR